MTNIFSKWKNGLTKTSKTTFHQITALFGGDIDENTIEDLEALLIQADIGVATTRSIIQSLKESQIQKNIIKSADLEKELRSELIKRLTPPPPIDIKERPTIILIVGVNGSGKTTTIAKLSYYFQQHNQKVLLGAADTYRAAAVDQLETWADRLHLPIIVGQPNGDSGAVAYDTVQAAISRNIDIAIIDTAGRLHTRFNLMEELKKVHRVIGKAIPTAPQHTWLVLDATTGQNALNQAKAFKEAVNIDGVIIAKLDSSAKGGMVFSIQSELGAPIYFAGLGESLEDLELFDPQLFVDGLLEKAPA